MMKTMLNKQNIKTFDGTEWTMKMVVVRSGPSFI